MSNKNIFNSGPHLIFWILIPFVLAYGIFADMDLEVNIHDTYIIVPYVQIIILLSFYLFISGLAYIMSRNGFNKKLKLIHIWTSLPGVLFILLGLINIQIAQINQDISVSPDNIYFFLTGFVLITIGFVIYLINTILAAVMRRM